MSKPQFQVVGAPAGELPITRGRLLDFPDDPIACMKKLQQTHGDMAAFEDEDQRLYFVFSPELNHQVLSDPVNFHSRFFAIRGSKKSAQRRLTSGLLSMNGEEHRRQRRLVMEAFQKKAIQTYLPTIQTLTGDILRDWQPGETRDISREMTELMLRVTSSILFGVADAELAYKIGRMIHDWVHMNHELGMGAFVSSPEIAARYEGLLEYAAELEREIIGLIDRRRGSDAPPIDALSLFLRAHDEQGSISDEQLVGQTALMFGAAHLTTAHSLTWTLLLLAQHPSVMQALHQEIEAACGDDAPRAEVVDQLPVLDRVIKESLRILPASSYSQRVTSNQVQLGPFALPPMAGVIFSQFMTHHSPSLYRDPDCFQPDRWLEITPSPYAYLPFGSGPRMCIGGPLAIMILKNVLPTLLQKFKLTMVPHSQVGAKVISTMLSPTTSIPMRIDHQDGRFESQPIRGDIHDLVEFREMAGVVRRAA